MINIGTLEGTLSLKDQFTQVLTKASQSAKEFRDEFSRTIRKASDDAQEFSQRTERLSGSLKSAGQALLGVSLAAAAAIGGVAKVTSDFESSFAGVVKTVDATDAELAKLSAGFRDLSKEIPVSINELHGIGEAAGQLGIATENILGFTRVMADLGVATNLSSTEAATSLARLANITQMNQRDFDRLGSTIVDLGNNFATTEAEIVEMSMRIAGAGAQIGLTEHQILAIGTTLSSVGIRAEAGGSAISKVMIDMAASVSEGGERLAMFARVANKTSKDFAEQFRKDAAGALNDFITGLGTLEARGTDALTVLAEMGIEEVRMRDALLRASGAGDLFAQTLDRASKAWQENNALTKEAEQRYSTFVSRVTILWNRLKDMAITVGMSLLPTMKDLLTASEPVIEGMAKLANWFAELPKPIRLAAAALLAITAAASPVLLALGSMAASISALAGLGVTGAAVVAFGKLALAIAGVTAVVVGTGRLLWVMGESIGLFRSASDAITYLQGVYSRLMAEVVKPTWSQLVRTLQQVWSTFESLARTIGSAVGIVFDLGQNFNTVAFTVKLVEGAIKAALVPMQLTLRVIEQTAKAIEAAATWADYFFNKGRGITPKLEAPESPLKLGGFELETIDAMIERGNRSTQALEIQLDMLGDAVGKTGEIGEGMKKILEDQEAARKAQIDAAARAYDDLIGGQAIRTAISTVEAYKQAREAGVKLSKEALERVNKDLIEGIRISERLFGMVPDGWREIADATAPAIQAVQKYRQEYVLLPQSMQGMNGAVIRFKASWDMLDLEQKANIIMSVRDGMDSWMGRLLRLNPMFDDMAKRLGLVTDQAKEAAKGFGTELKGGISDALHEIPRLLQQGFTGGGGLGGALKAIGVSMANAVIQPMLKQIRELSGRQSGAITAGVAGAGAVGGELGGQAGALIGTSASAIAGATLATTALGVAAKTSWVAMAGLSAATLGVGAAAVGVYLLARRFFGVSEEVKKAREQIQNFQQALHQTMTEAQRNEAAGREWAATVIVVRDAYLRLGRSAEEAEDAVRRLWNDKDPEEARRAMHEISTVVDALQKHLHDANQEFTPLLTQAMELGRRLPQALLDSIQKLVDMGDLTEENAALLKQLTDQGEIDWNRMREAAERYGIDVNGLGQQYHQLRLTDAAKQILNDFELLKAGGADVGAVLLGMHDEISALAQESIKFGTTIPENMRPLLENLVEAGKLLDENGEAITDLKDIKFGDPLKTEFERITDALEDLVDTIQNDLVNALRNIPSTVPVRVRPEIEWPEDGRPERRRDPAENYNVGTLGRLGKWFGDFPASGRDVRVHNREAIVTEAQAPAFAMDILGTMAGGASGAGGGGGVVPVVMRIQNHEVFGEIVLAQADDLLALRGGR